MSQSELEKLAERVREAKNHPDFPISPYQVGLGLLEGAKEPDGPEKTFDNPYAPDSAYGRMLAALKAGFTPKQISDAQKNGAEDLNGPEGHTDPRPPGVNSTYPYGGNNGNDNDRPSINPNGGITGGQGVVGFNPGGGGGSGGGTGGGGNQPQTSGRDPDKESSGPGSTCGGSDSNDGPNRPTTNTPSTNNNGGGTVTGNGAGNPANNPFNGGNPTTNPVTHNNHTNNVNDAIKGGIKGKGGTNAAPVIFDLDGDGIEITEFSRSTMFLDTGGEGFKHRTAWAGVGDAVLFYDADGSGTISEKREFIFSEWDPTARSDFEALHSVFDTNHNGKLDGTELQNFKVMVTNADGTTSIYALNHANVNIASIGVIGDTTHIELPDGSVIDGQALFTRGDTTTGTAANTSLVTATDGYKVDAVATMNGANKVVTSTGYEADGSKVFVYKSETTPTGNSITNSYDDNGDGTWDRVQTIVTNTASANGVRNYGDIPGLHSI
ncbi:MAG: hypothetical protein ACKVP5_05635 [Aestuariivirga sp.]